jgi:hypothetical protein
MLKNSLCIYTSVSINYIVAYRPVAKRLLCKQQLLLWSACSLCVRGDVTTIEEVMQVMFSVGPLQGYMTQLTVFGSVSKCSTVGIHLRSVNQHATEAE